MYFVRNVHRGLPSPVPDYSTKAAKTLVGANSKNHLIIEFLVPYYLAINCENKKNSRITAELPHMRLKVT